MPFPESPRVIYKRNPLVEVICQLKFPTILRIGTGDIAIFQDKIRAQYPLYESREAALEFLNIPKELSAIVEKLPIPKPAGTITHRFLTKDRERLIALSQDFLAFSTTNYQRWESFREEIKKAEEALREVFSPAFYTRIGLRYKDLITPQELGLGDKKWGDLFAEHVVGELGDVRIAAAVSEIKTRAIIQIPDIPGAQVTFIHGLARNDEKTLLSYLIDADFALEETEETHGTIEVLDTFNRLAGRLFRWAITNSLHEAMEPQAIK